MSERGFKLGTQPDLEFARYLDRNNAIASHIDIPTLACPIDGSSMAEGEPVTIDEHRGTMEASSDDLFYSLRPGQKYGDPVSYQSSAK